MVASLISAMFRLKPAGGEGPNGTSVGKPGPASSRTDEVEILISFPDEDDEEQKRRNDEERAFIRLHAGILNASSTDRVISGGSMAIRTVENLPMGLRVFSYIAACCFLLVFIPVVVNMIRYAKKPPRVMLTRILLMLAFAGGLLFTRHLIGI